MARNTDELKSDKWLIPVVTYVNLIVTFDGKVSEDEALSLYNKGLSKEILDMKKVDTVLGDWAEPIE